VTPCKTPALADDLDARRRRAKGSPTRQGANDPRRGHECPSTRAKPSCFIAAMRSFSSALPGHAARPSRARPASWRRSSAAVCAAVLVLLSSAGPLAVAAAAAGSSSVLGQAQGSNSAPSPSGSPGGSSSAGSNGSASLDPKADFNAPGVDAGRRLIAWAKAGAMVLGTLGLIGGSVVGKLLRQAGNHHAEGVRATAMGVGGALVLAGSASTIVTWLMSA